MSIFKYSDKEKDLNKVLKLNQSTSTQLLNDEGLTSTRSAADDNIDSTIALLQSLGYGSQVEQVKCDVQENSAKHTFQNHPPEISWDELVNEANAQISNEITLEDLLTPAEINSAFIKRDEIDALFSKRTSIINKTDLSFLAVATSLQVAKALLFPYIANKFGYGDTFDPNDRLKHNDPSIENAHREANDAFRDKHQAKSKNGHWINILYQTPPYDITVGSGALGINMEGKYHRLHTMGHDPILGWLFGTANILTDVITLNDFRSFRVDRKPKMRITSTPVSIGMMLQESYAAVKDDYLNLPAAIFAQAQHLKSDEYTKTGLPVPLLAAFNENYASALYKNHYDSLCFARDMKIVGASFGISLLIDSIIGIVHGLFRQPEEDVKLFEVRTRKILLLSNSLASSSSIIHACITSNPKNLDIGSLLSTTAHLFRDIRFITKIKEEFIENEIYKQLQKELDEIDDLWRSMG